MESFRLLPLRRLVLISLVLGLFVLTGLSQANDGGINDDNNNSKRTSSSTTSSTKTNPSTTTTSSTSQSTISTTDNGTETSLPGFSETSTPEAIAPTQPATATATQIDQFSDSPNAAFDEVLEKNGSPEIVADEGGGLLSGSTSSFGNIIRTSTIYLTLSFVLFLVLSAPYAMVYNNEEVRDYINRSMKLAGFSEIVTVMGRTWKFMGEGTIRMKGIMNLTLFIKLPIYGDPREYGLTIKENFAVTQCSIEMFPLKLQVLRLYLKQT